MSEHPEELTPEERRLFDRLPRERPVPQSLEARVIEAASAAGVLARAGAAGAGHRARPVSGRRPWLRAVSAAAAAVLLLAAGTWYGRQTAPGVNGQPVGELDRASFALVLYDGPEFEAYTDQNYPARFEDYNRWIGDLRSRGRFVGGESLDATAMLLRPSGGSAVVEERMPTGGDGPISGILFINADSYEEANEIASSIPHIRYGGRVAVRRVQPT